MLAAGVQSSMAREKHDHPVEPAAPRDQCIYGISHTPPVRVAQDGNLPAVPPEERANVLRVLDSAAEWWGASVAVDPDAESAAAHRRCC